MATKAKFDKETADLETIYGMLSHHPRAAQCRMLDWLSSRLSEDRSDEMNKELAEWGENRKTAAE